MEKKKVLLPITFVCDLGVVPAELTGCFSLFFIAAKKMLF